MIWYEKHRPKDIEECALPVITKDIVGNFIERGEFPNLLLYGPPGVGKTTVARILINKLDLDYIFINGSLDGNKDTLKNKISDFASSVSMTDRKKVVLLDEADMMSSFMQPALRAFMEEFHENCQFILTCNYKDKIIEPLHSRCSLIDFSINKSEKKQVLQTFIKSCIRILKAEDIEFDLKALSTFVMLKFPDFRNTINELQAYGQINKRIDSGILATTRDTDLDHLITYLKEKRFTDMRKWVAENWSMGITEFGKRFEKSTEDLIKKESVPVLVLHLAEYEYKDSFVINKEINLAALCTELMRDLEWQM